MFTVLAVVNTAPAMPRWLGSLISPTASPMAMRENSSAVFSSLRKSVERSAFSIRVASAITLLRSAPSSSSEVTSATMSRNSISCWRVFCMRSTNWVLWSATAACVVMAARSSRSSAVKVPSSLLRHWMTPIISPFSFLTGAHRMLLVRKPVCSSIALLKRSSA